MLTAAQALRLDRRRRPRPSTKQQYDELDKTTAKMLKDQPAA